MRNGLKSLIMVICYALITSGCSLTKPSEETQFYLLSSPSLPAGSVPAEGAVVWVGAIKMPDYLKRNSLVTRMSENRYQVAKFDLWGGSLESETQMALYRQLQRALPDQFVQMAGTGPETPGDLSLRVVVYRFDVAPGSVVRLEAEWGWFNSRNQRVHSGRFVRTLPSGIALETNVAKMSQLWGLLADEVASALPVKPR